MILQALTAYYEQLLKQGKVEAPGWDSKFKVSYELRLGPDGQLLALNDLRKEVPKGKKTVTAPRELPVPHRVKRASGVAANFLCDNTSYLLGADEKGKPERSRQCFEACAALHHKVLDGVDDIAICRFSEKDVVRHRLVQDIIKAYEKYYSKQEAKQDAARRSK